MFCLNVSGFGVIDGKPELVDGTDTDAIPVEASRNAGVPTASLKEVTVAGKSEVSPLLEAVTSFSCLGGVEMPKLSNTLLRMDSRAP